MGRNDSGKVRGNWPACPMIPLVCPSSPKISYLYIPSVMSILYIVYLNYILLDNLCIVLCCIALVLYGVALYCVILLIELGVVEGWFRCMLEPSVVDGWYV